MAFTKETIEDRIAVIGDYKHIQVRTAIVVKEDGTEISRSHTDKILTPGTLDSSDNLISTDVSGESTEVQSISNQVWTTAVKNAWKTYLLSLSQT
tara:strand:- start:96 stop:380 length:285 start_codon:yes stop_codon:yes gene_type:complete